jgi:hypothetical protein
MDQTQKLTIQAEVQGAQRSAEELQRIAAAQEQVNRAAANGAAANGGAGGATSPGDDATLKFKDLNNVLSILDPRLGALVGRLSRAAEAFGELGIKGIDFAAVGKGLIETLTKMGPALGLLAAGGAAAGGIGFLISQFQRARREAEELRESMERIGRAQTDIGRERIETVDQVVAARDRMRQTPSATEEQRAAIDATLLQASLRGASKDVQSQLASLMVGLLGASDTTVGTGGEFTLDDLMAMTEQGFQVEPGISARRNERRARQFLGMAETRKDRATIRQRNERIKELGFDRSREEGVSRDPTVGTANLDMIIEEVAKQYGAPPDEVRRAVIDRLKKEDDLRAGGVLDDVILNVRRAFISRHGPSMGPAIDEVLRSLGGNVPPSSQTPVERPPVAPPPEQRKPGTPVSTTINHYNSRFIGSDAAAQRGRMRNGETLAREMEA